MRNWMLWLIYGRELVVLITDGLVCKFLLCKMNIFVSKNGHNYSLVKSARVSPFPSNSSAISMIWCIFGTLCFVHYCKRFWRKYAKSLNKYHKQTTFILFFFPVKFYTCELMNIINISAQFIFTNYFLGNQFGVVAYEGFGNEEHVSVLPITAVCHPWE